MVTVRAMWSARTVQPRWLAGLGLFGTLCISGSSYWVAAIPIYFRHKKLPVVSLLPVGAFQARIVYYLGLSSLILAWLYLGRLVQRNDGSVSTAFLRRAALGWAAPLMLAIPLASRDLWAYAAQSQLVLHHLDPYTLGPSALPGAFAEEVSHRWVDTPAPYGPLWLWLGRMIAALIGPHVGQTVAALRLVAGIGFVMMAYTLPALTRHARGRTDFAMWFVIANPMTLVLGVGGGHNDMLMTGLMMAGLVLVTGERTSRRGLLVGAILISAAVAVKSPAAIALAFAVPLWMTHRVTAHVRPSWRLVAEVSTAALALSGAVFAAFTWFTGLGFGWVKQVNSSTTVVSWMSLPSGAAILWDVVRLKFHRSLKYDHEMGQFRTVGSAIAIVILIIIWFYACQRSIKAAGGR